MVATNLKSETTALMEKRASIEAEMNAIIESLCGPGDPGISGDLVDREGFPRSDIDIPAIRSQRARLAALRNDHKDITDKIEKNLQVLHSVRVAKVAPLPSKDSDTSVYVHESTSQDSSMGEEPIVRIPFAMIDEIAYDSPAAEDGLQLGDEILKFGNVEIGGELQSRLVLEAQSNQGHPISMVIIRQGSVMNLSVTPRTWRGRGLLGLVPISYLRAWDIIAESG
ncbi:26S proteasome non-ATPase regulatory subunit 9-like isoform X1 [Phoenix dactylifera]|uniref:26S proteasome non-ATPase regulatory subunit 9-like isoform X1 n=1 Tax=Phoenix dactylifera TaxID=42345 RepID=A0A8B8J2N2_PHODC|nr:26S proteasome non-ATPase regulatory subunit 9-like isoform X1 [Phoenix dactylifera]